MSTLRRVRKTASVTEKTYHSLQRAITQNRLLPGQALVIGDLAAELGVSRTPVREALLMLEKTGLVETSNGRILVAGLSLGDLDEVFELREAIELFCLEKVNAAVDKARLKPLRHMLEAELEPDGPTEAESAATVDLRFHRALVTLAGNGRLLAAWQQAATHLQRFWRDGQTNLERARSDLLECLAVVEALEQGDAGRASTMLREHLLQTKASLAVWEREQTEV